MRGVGAGVGGTKGFVWCMETQLGGVQEHSGSSEHAVTTMCLGGGCAGDGLVLEVAGGTGTVGGCAREGAVVS